MTTKYTEFELINQHTSIVFQFDLPNSSDILYLNVYISNYKLNKIFTEFLKTIFPNIKICNDISNRNDISIKLIPLEFIYYSNKLKEFEYQNIYNNSRYNIHIYSKYFKNKKYSSIVEDIKKIFISSENNMIEYVDKKIENDNNLIKNDIFKYLISDELYLKNKYDYLINAVNFDLF